MEQQHTSFFIRIGEQIIKAHMNIDIEKLKLIIKEMIDNCSIITSVNNSKEVSYNFKDYYNNYHYRNIKIRVEEYPYRDAGYGDDDHPGIRYVSYTYYDYPELIDELISIINEEDSLDSFNISFAKSKDKLLDLHEEENKMRDIINSNIEESKKWKELRKLTKDIVEYTDPNKQKPTARIKDYFENILSCFQIMKVEISTKEEIKDFYSFYSFLEFDEDIFSMAISSIDEKDPILKDWIIKEIGNPKKHKSGTRILQP